MKKPEIKKLLRDLRRRASSFGEFLSFLEEAFPSLESDAKIIQDIRSIPALPETPAPHQVTNLRNLISAKILYLRESPTSHQKLEWLWSKIPDAIWDELKKKEYQARFHSYEDVFQVLMELAEDRERVDSPPSLPAPEQAHKSVGSRHSTTFLCPSLHELKKSL